MPPIIEITAYLHADPTLDSAPTFTITSSTDPAFVPVALSLLSVHVVTETLCGPNPDPAYYADLVSWLWTLDHQRFLDALPDGIIVLATTDGWDFRARVDDAHDGYDVLYRFLTKLFITLRHTYDGPDINEALSKLVLNALTSSLDEPS